MRMGESGGLLSDLIFWICRGPGLLASFLREARNTSPEGRCTCCPLILEFNGGDHSLGDWSGWKSMYLILWWHIYFPSWLWMKIIGSWSSKFISVKKNQLERKFWENFTHSRKFSGKWDHIIMWSNGLDTAVATAVSTVGSTELWKLLTTI